MTGSEMRFPGDTAARRASVSVSEGPSAREGENGAQIAVERIRPVRLQLSRKKGYRLPLGAKSVARPHRWGNPFKVSRPSTWMLDWGPGLAGWQVVRAGRSPGDGHYGRYPTQLAATQRAVSLFRDWLTGTHVSSTADAALMVDLPELRGHDLACWCPLDMPCHADVLIELANGGGDD